MSLDVSVLIVGTILAGMAGLFWSARQSEKSAAEQRRLLEHSHEIQQRSAAILDRQEALLRRAESLMERLERHAGPS